MTTVDKYKGSHIDFTLQLEDYAKVVVLVKDVLATTDFINKSYQCDMFNSSECHHVTGHETNQDRLTANKCGFCKFTQLLRERHSSVDIIQSKSANDKQNLFVRYRSSDPVEMLQWCEFQPWRTPYALFAYARCNNKSDVFNALENFEEIKKQYKKTLITSRLFVDMANCDDKALNELIPRYLGVSQTDMSTLNIDEEIKRSNQIIEKNLSNFNFNRNNSIFQFDIETREALAQNSKIFNRNASIFQQDPSLNLLENTPQINLEVNPMETIFEIEDLEEKLKFHKSEIIYLDHKSNESKQEDLIYKEKKISIAIKEATSIVYHKILNMAHRVNTSEEKQLNYYSEFLQSPMEVSEDSKAKKSSSSSFLSIKLFNRKIVSARMTKYKADLYLTLNMVDSAFVHYAQAYAATKKENDTYWSLASLEGLLAVSYLFLRHNTKPESQALLNAWKKKFSSQKDLNKLAIPFVDFAKNYTHILTMYNKNEVSSFLGLEISIMVSKFFIQFKMKAEALTFINYSIYISNLNMIEESRIRRFYEISHLYNICGMKRLSSFYRWISSSRVYRLLHLESDKLESQNIHRTCLVNRCVGNLIKNFDIMKLTEQLRPVQITTKEIISNYGFPKAKKHLVMQSAELFSYLENSDEIIKFTKYLVNEFSSKLCVDELKFYSKVLITMNSSENNRSLGKFDEFKTKFYNIPKLELFKIETEDLGVNKIGKIISENIQASNGIYIHRYKNPLLSARVKTVYSLRAENINTIQMTFSNSLPIELCVKSLNLLVESHSDQKRFEIQTYQNNKTKCQEFIVPANADIFQIQVSFNFSELGKFTILGYDINFWGNSNTILFSDLVQSEQKIYGNNKNRLICSNQNLLQPSYDIEIIPMIPIIEEIEFKLKDSNNNFQIVDSLTQKKSAIVRNILGIQSCYLLSFTTNGQSNVEILQVTSTVLSDHVSSKLSASVTIKNENESFYLVIDSSKIPSDSLISLPEHLEASCMFDVKYTNQKGQEANLNHTFRKQFTIKFEQAFHSHITNIREIDVNNAQVNFVVSNLFEDPIHLELESRGSLEISGNSTNEFSVTIKKLSIFEKLDKINFNEILIGKLNESLDSYLKFFINFHQIKPKFNDERIVFKFKNLLVKCPLDIVGHLNQNNSGINESSEQLYSLAMVIRNKESLDDFLRSYEIIIEIRNKLKNKIFNPQTHRIQDLKDNKTWFNDYSLVLSSDQNSMQNELHIQVNLTRREANVKENELEWVFKLDLRPETEQYLLN